jgi:hypothetical protein
MIISVHIQGVTSIRKMDAQRSSRTLVTTYKTIWSQDIGDHCQYRHRLENRKSQIFLRFEVTSSL